MPAFPRRFRKLSADANFRLYRNDDVIGLELGGSVKNVIAIAAGSRGRHRLRTQHRGRA